LRYVGIKEIKPNHHVNSGYTRDMYYLEKVK